MDNLTHSLVGALLGQAGLKRKTGLAMPALIIGANLPDVDAACTAYGIESLAMRRGITHGPIAWVLLPVVLAGLLWVFDRWQAGRGKRPDNRLPVQFGWLYALSFSACLTHPALDWLNSYGIRLLEPFSSRWFYGDAIFIIDIWLWLLLGLAAWVSLRRERRGANGQGPARAALAVACVYIGMNILGSYLVVREARSRQPQAAIIASPVPFAFWQRDLLGISPGTRNFRQRFDLFRANGEVEWLTIKGPCALRAPGSYTAARPDVAAFLFWSRMPYAEPKGEGIIIRDARFSSTLAGDRFTVTLPGDACEKPRASF